jgi:hypothetical protein
MVIRNLLNISIILIITCSCKGKQEQAGEFPSDMQERISLDFSLTQDEITARLEKLAVKVSEEDIKRWEEKKWLEYMMIDGEKKYFNRAASNLLLLKKFHEDKNARFSEISNDPRMIFRREHTEKVIKESGKDHNPVLPVKMRINYTLTVKQDVVPHGEVIRCWLPWPKGTHPRQQAAGLISVSEPLFVISDENASHRTIYMEKKAIRGEPAVFKTAFNYTSSGQYYDLSSANILPYNKRSKLYLTYTREELPNICFSDNVKKLTDSIVTDTDPPEMVVRKIYLWFKENIPWTGALEYSIMPNIPEYVIANRRGDCGMQTFLFMSMLRYKGIPVKWQSGWMVPPGAENLHDWCEVWYEGVGWIPVDISYDLQSTDDPRVREFYLSGIDSYRMIVNDGISGPLLPAKKHPRSEPFDFQRGEVEWKGGNLYFDKWDYEMEIVY